MRLSIRGLGRFVAVPGGLPPGVHNTSAVSPGGPVGAVFGSGAFNDGREFRLAKNGAVALVAGRLLQEALPVADFNNLAVAAAALGAVQVTVTLGNTALLANQMAGGVLYVNDAGAAVTTEGYSYDILSHPAADASAACVITLSPRTPIHIALTTASQVTLMPNRYSGLLIHASPPTAAVVGVAPTAVPIDEYFYVQTKGRAAVITQGTLVIGDSCVPSATVDGAVMPSAAFETDGPVVGIVSSVNVDTEESLIFLTL